jgi:hypothetical protein
MSLTSPLVPIEDLFVTGILASKCGFSIQHIPGFHIKRIDACNSTVDILLAHNIFPEEQKLVQQILNRRPGDNCTWDQKRRF